MASGAIERPIIWFSRSRSQAVMNIVGEFVMMMPHDGFNDELSPVLSLLRIPNNLFFGLSAVLDCFQF